MQPVRRLSLQLTPLLDLLLIVIFAQFMEVREDQSAVQQQAIVANAEKDAALAKLMQVQTALEALRQEVTITELRMARSMSDAERYQRDLVSRQNDLDRAIAQHRVLGELVVELFQVPVDEVNKILNTSVRPSGSQSPQELEDLKNKFRDIAMQQSGQMIEHLLTYEEIRKRCDVWKLHIDEANFVRLEVGDQRYSLQSPFNFDDDVDGARLLTELHALYRSLPQPKDLVIILLTYDRKSRINVTRSVRDLMPQLIAKMQTEQEDRIRFEYADLGFRIQ